MKNGFFSGKTYQRCEQTNEDVSKPLLPHSPVDCNPPPLRSFLTRPILLACTNYCILGALHSSSNVLQPLFLAMPISIGGLALPPNCIGYILGAYGFVNALVQTFLLGRLIRRFGAKNVFVTAMTALIPTFVMPPLMNMVIRIFGWEHIWWRWTVITMLSVQVASGFILELGYGMNSVLLTSFMMLKRHVYRFHIHVH